MAAAAVGGSDSVGDGDSVAAAVVGTAGSVTAPADVAVAAAVVEIRRETRGAVVAKLSGSARRILGALVL